MTSSFGVNCLLDYLKKYAVQFYSTLFRHILSLKRLTMICSSIWSRLSGILCYISVTLPTAPHRVEADPGQHQPRPPAGLPHLWRQAPPQPHQQGGPSLSELQYCPVSSTTPPVSVKAHINTCDCCSGTPRWLCIPAPATRSSYPARPTSCQGSPPPPCTGPACRSIPLTPTS